jgi:hypothetical protein
VIGSRSQYSRSLCSNIKLYIYTFHLLFAITILWKLNPYRSLCTFDRRIIKFGIIHSLPIAPRGVGVSASLTTWWGMIFFLKKLHITSCFKSRTTDKPQRINYFESILFICCMNCNKSILDLPTVCRDNRRLWSTVFSNLPHSLKLLCAPHKTT